MSQRIKDGILKTESEVRLMYPNVSFGPSTYDELGWLHYTPPSPTLEARRESRVRDVAAELGARLSSYAHDFGPGYGVLHLQLRDNDDRTNWLTLRTTATDLILAGLGDNPVLAIRTEENITVSLNALQAAQVMGAMAAWGGAMLAAGWAHKDAVRVSDDPESIDITQGWPA